MNGVLRILDGDSTYFLKKILKIIIFDKFQINLIKFKAKKYFSIEESF